MRRCTTESCTSCATISCNFCMAGSAVLFVGVIPMAIVEWSIPAIAGACVVVVLRGALDEAPLMFIFE